VVNPVGVAHHRKSGDRFNNVVRHPKTALITTLNPVIRGWTNYYRTCVAKRTFNKTPFGRVGGAICFDSFTRETFEGFKKSAVELVVVVACWGLPRPVRGRPDLRLSHPILRLSQNLAADVMPYQIDIPPRYLSADYYFVRPPRRDKLIYFLGNFMQAWGVRDLQKEYEERRARHID